MFVVTISRQTGSMGDEISGLLSKKLNFRLITHNEVISEWLPDIASKYDMDMLKESSKYYINKSKEAVSFAEYIEQKLKEASANENLVVLGLGAQVIFKGVPDIVNIRISATDTVRRKRIQQAYGLDEAEAERFIELSDRRHKKYLKTLYDKDWADFSLYDICLNTDNISVEEAVSLLCSAVEIRTRPAVSSEVGSIADTDTDRKPKVRAFVHPAEEEFAKILDMYMIEWEYEPKTFPTEWDAEGNVIKAFTPDFYLPRFNTYIEITTMDQKYVTEKKRKVRRLKELYPEVNINIVFKRDFHSLLKRFGLE